MTPLVMAESEEELKSLLIEVKEESENPGLKLNIQNTKIMASSPITSWQINGETMDSDKLYSLGLQNHCRWWLQRWNQKTLAPWKTSYDQPRQHNKKQRHYHADKGPSSQNYGFSSGHVWMWELDHKESWAPNSWCFWTVVLEKTLESPLDCEEIQPVNPKGNLSWLFIGSTDATAETPILWPPDEKNWLIGKDPDAGKDWRQEKGMTEDEMAGWHHWLDGHELEQSPGVGDRQGSLVCCSPWGCKVGHDWAELRDPRRFQSEFKWSKKVAAGTRSLCFIFMTNNFLHK